MTTPLRIDPLPLNCPRCGEKLTHVWTNDDVPVYHCPNNGVVVIPPDGHIRVAIH